MSQLSRNADRVVAVVVAALFCLSYGIRTARADVVMDWNATAAASPTHGAPELSRVMATMHGAIHDALNSIEPVYQAYRFRVEASPGASKDAAAAAAAHFVLTALVPAHRSVFDLALAASLSKVPEGRLKTDGIAVGRTAARAMLDWRAKAHSRAKLHGQAHNAPAAAQRVPLLRAHGVLPDVGDIALFLGTPAADSRAESTASTLPLRDFDEVRNLGGRYSTSRTAEQTAVALFWAGNEVLLLNAAARAASQAKKLSIHENARLFALLHMVSADAAVAPLDMSFNEDEAHPVEVIRAGYGTIAADAGWEPLLVTAPNHGNPLRHCIITGAAVQLLREHFGFDQISFDFISPGALGMKRSYESFWQIAIEMEDARVWAGIHFRSIVERSTEIGRRMGAHAVASYMRPL
jgi:hypothetical protein